MKKSYTEQMKDIVRKEEMSARKHGFETVEEWREFQAKQNRIKTYEAKIARYEEAITEMKAYIEANK
jgi:predicted RNase H-like nuclease (RuvC/YqgF family)